MILNQRCWRSLGGQHGKGVNGLFENVSFQKGRKRENTRAKSKQSSHDRHLATKSTKSPSLLARPAGRQGIVFVAMCLFVGGKKFYSYRHETIRVDWQLSRAGIIDIPSNIGETGPKFPRSLCQKCERNHPIYFKLKLKYSFSFQAVHGVRGQHFHFAVGWCYSFYTVTQKTRQLWPAVISTGMY